MEVIIVEVREMRLQTGLSQSKFAKMFDIPVSTLKDWEQERRNPPVYVINMMRTILQYKGMLVRQSYVEECDARRKSVAVKKTIHESIYQLPDISHENWLKDFSDFPNMKSMIYQLVNSQKFVLLNGWYSWEQKRKIGEEKYHNPLKNMWVQINSYIVKKENLETDIKALKDTDFMGRYLAEPSDNYTLFNKEYYWSHGYRFFQNPYYGGEERVSLDKYGERYSHLPDVLVPTRKYLTERDGDLLYEDSHSTWYKPCLELFKGLGMQYGKENSVLYDENGKILCFDSIELLGEDIGFFVDEEKFSEFLEKEGYSIFWTILSEKRILTGYFSDKKEYDMPHISGIFYLDEQKKLVGELFDIKED